MKKQKLAAFSVLAAACALSLQGCVLGAGDGTDNDLSLSSSRLYGDYRVDCYHDSSFTNGRGLYVFKAAGEQDYRSLAKDGFEKPSSADIAIDGKPLLWVGDESFACDSKGFYAFKAPSGEIEPAALLDASESGPSRDRLEGRQWKGWRIDCMEDTSWGTHSKGYYQARKATPEELARLPLWGEKFRKVGALGGRSISFVADSSWSCRLPGFYAVQEGGQAMPVGLASGQKSGKSIKTTAVLLEKTDGSLALSMREWREDRAKNSDVRSEPGLPMKAPF